MKKVMVKFVVFAVYVAILTCSSIFAAGDRCKITIPQDARILKSDKTLLNDNMSYVITNDANIQVNGSDNFLILRSGASGTINGANNTVYLESDCELTLMGENNEIVAGNNCDVKRINPENSVSRCRNLVITQLGGGSEHRDALQVLTDLGNSLQKKKKKKGPSKDKPVMVEATADPSNNLIGTWNVIGASFMNQDIPASGKIILNKKGLGYQEYELDIQGEKVAQTGLFRWRSDDSSVYIDEVDEDTVTWKRLTNAQNTQRILVRMENKLRISMNLQRIK